jgi:hypothetical protein
MNAQVARALDAPAQTYYRQALRLLTAARVPYLLGGAYAFARYTDIARHTKDLDLFLRQADVAAARAAFERAGFRTELTYEHWLAKAFADGHFVDLIFNLGNGSGPVDDAWFDRALDDALLGVPVKLVGPAELVFSKVFTMDRGRYDGADVAHLLRALSDRLDWPRLLDYCDRHWRVLLSHLVLFGFIYPADRHRIPTWVMQNLLSRVQAESHDPPPGRPVCQGTLLSPTEYRVDVEEWGYRDARLPPGGAMTPAQVEDWMAGVRAGR